MTYAKVERDLRAQRAVRHFGGRTVIRRQDEVIADGICDPEQCPQYQARHCNLSASFIFAVPDIKGLGLIELPTNSIYVLQKAYSAMQTVQLARGKLTGTRFWITKRDFDITRINENGEAVRTTQPLTVLDADIDIGALLDAADDAVPALEAANQVVALIEASGNVVPIFNADQPGDTLPPGDVPESAEASGSPSGQATGNVEAPESLSDKRDRMSDLLQRLGLGADDRKQNFRIYAHMTFGRGWAERPADVEKMNARLTAALDDPDALNEEIKQAASFV